MNRVTIRRRILSHFLAGNGLVGGDRKGKGVRLLVTSQGGSYLTTMTTVSSSCGEAPTL